MDFGWYKRGKNGRFGQHKIIKNLKLVIRTMSQMKFAKVIQRMILIIDKGLQKVPEIQPNGKGAPAVGEINVEFI